MREARLAEDHIVLGCRSRCVNSIVTVSTGPVRIEAFAIVPIHIVLRVNISSCSPSPTVLLHFVKTILSTRRLAAWINLVALQAVHLLPQSVSVNLISVLGYITTQIEIRDGER